MSFQNVLQNIQTCSKISSYCGLYGLERLSSIPKTFQSAFSRNFPLDEAGNTWQAVAVVSESVQKDTEQIEKKFFFVMKIAFVIF